MAAWAYAERQAHGWMDDRDQEVAETIRLARRASELGKDDADTLSQAGFALSLVAHDHDAAATYFDRALALNPNLASAWAFSGWLRVWTGEPELAIEHTVRALRLNPLDPEIFRMHSAIAFAHFSAGRINEASQWAERAVQENPNFLPGNRMAAASHALAGRLEQAKAAMNRVRALYPDLRVSHLKKITPFRRREDLARYEDGLRKAGLPE